MRKTHPSHLPSALPRPGRTGFTLLELIIVISIIALLAGIVAVGMWGALGSTRDRGTESRLETLSTMLANHATADQATGGSSVRKLPSVLRAVPASGDLYSTVDGRWDSGSAAAGDPIIAPTASGPDDIVASPTLMSPEAARTQAVLRRLLSIPANSDLFASLPDDVKTLNVAAGGDVNYSGGTGPGPLDPPLLLDGHGGVILFVPEAGMTGLAFKDGRFAVTVRAADGGAFWVSAGEDGSFGAQPGEDDAIGTADDLPGADDNVYSTQVVYE